MTIAPDIEQSAQRLLAADEGDITERKRMEQRLQASEARFRAIFANAAVGLAEVSPDGRFLLVNDRLCEIVGYPPAELTQKTCMELTHPDDLAADWEKSRSVLAGDINTYSLEKRYFHKNGSIVWIHLRVSLVRKETGEPDYFVSAVDDITERKKMQQMVEEARTRFQAIFDQAPVGMALLGTDLRWQDVNTAFARMIGFGVDELRDQLFAAHTHPDDVHLGEDTVHHAIQDAPATFHHEKRFLHRNGSEVWADVQTTLIPGIGGDRPTLLRIIQDITARKAAEEGLARARRSYQWLVESNPAGLVETKMGGEVISANDAFFSLIGWDRAEFFKAGMDLEKLTPREWMPVSDSKVDACRRTRQPVVYEKEYFRRDGTRVPVMVGLSFREDSDQECVAFILDLTEQKRAEQAVRESENQFRTLANAIPQLCWMADADGWIFWYNQRWYDYTGSTPEQMEGWGWQSVHDPRTLPSVLERWKTSLETGRPFDMVFPLRGADGVFRPFLTRIMPVRDQDGRIVRWFGTNTDIGEQRRVEDELRKSEERFRALVTATSDVVYSMSANWGEMRHLVGRAFIEDTLESTTSWLSKYIHPEDQAYVSEAIEEAIRQKKTFALEHRVKRADGTLGWTNSRAVPILDQSGEILEWFGAASDITELKRAEQALRYSEERFRIVVEASPSGIVMVGEDGKIALVNAQTEKLFGYTRAELLGSRVEELIPVDKRGRHPTHRASFAASPGVRAMRAGRELFGLRKDGSEVPIEIGLSPVSTPDGQYVLATVIDITERKAAEKAVRERDRWIRLLADAMPQIVWTANPDGRVDYYNRRWYEFTGFPEGVGGEENWKPVLHPDDVAPGLNTWHEAVSSGQPYESQFRFWDRQRARWRWHLGRALPIREADGQISKWVGTSTDIDDYKRLSDQLEQRVTERTEDLRHSLREKETLLKEVHHRVKNNLQVICSLLALQKSSCQSGTPPESALQNAYDRVLSMALIHEKLYQSPTLSDLDFGAYIELLTHQLLQAYLVKPDQVRLHLSVEPIHIGIDQAIPCGLILNELVSNSLKHAFQSGTHGNLSVSFLTGSDRRVALTVADDGAGLPADVNFETTNSLGLQVVRTLVRQLDAELRVDSDHGTRIEIILKLTE